MGKKELPMRKTEIITHEQRLAEDPRGLTRLTVIGDFIFREVKVPKPVIEELGEIKEE